MEHSRFLFTAVIDLFCAYTLAIPYFIHQLPYESEYNGVKLATVSLAMLRMADSATPLARKNVCLAKTCKGEQSQNSCGWDCSNAV